MGKVDEVDKKLLAELAELKAAEGAPLLWQPLEGMNGFLLRTVWSMLILLRAVVLGRLPASRPPLAPVS